MVSARQVSASRSKRVVEWRQTAVGRESGRQFIRYALVGIVSNVSGYLVYLLITYLGVPPKPAMTMLYVVGATLGFLGNHSITFNYQGRVLGAGARYIVIHAIGYLLNLSLLVIFVDRLGYSHQVVQAAAVLVVATFLFIAFKLFVFRPHPGQ